MTDISKSTVSAASQASQEPVTDEREVPLAVLTFLAFLVGVVAALGSIVFKVLISVIYNLAFYGRLVWDMNPNAYGPPITLGLFIILVPVIGGLGVVFLVQKFAPEARGHGVPEVMYAVYHNRGNVRGVVAVIKSLASALSMGTGASVGREGPIIQIGSSFGSTFARLLKLTRPQKITLLSAGAGAGIAATFNTPLGGVLFASEIILPEISARSFLPVVVATATATYFDRMAIGVEATFVVPIASMAAHHTVDLVEVLLATITGTVMGLAAWAFVVLLARLEDVFQALPVNPYVQHVVGMTIVGLLGYGFLATTGHPHVMSVGYSTIQEILDGKNVSILLLVLLFAAKLLATCVSLGSGASGGIFSPSLFMGASLGAAIGVIGQRFFPGADVSVSTMAMIGMGAMVGGATGAAMTAIVMIFEMTRDYNIILPLVIAVAIAIGVRRGLVTSDIYTIKLRARGRPIPTDRSTNMFLVQPASDIMSRSFEILPADYKVSEALQTLDIETVRHVVLTDGQRIVGFVRFGTIPYRADRFINQTLGDISSNEFIIAAENSTLNTVITRMSKRSRSYAIVIKANRGVPRPEDIVGIIDREEVAQAVVHNHYA